jgi:hypothetical protein
MKSACRKPHITTQIDWRHLRSRKAASPRAWQSSLFYLVLAHSCFQRARGSGDPKTGAALRDIGRDYLMKATKTSSAFQARRPQVAPVLGVMNEIG